MGNTSSNKSAINLCAADESYRLEELSLEITPGSEPEVEWKYGAKAIFPTLSDDNNNDRNGVKSNDPPSLFHRVGGPGFLQIIVERLELNDSELQRNVRVDLQGALTRSAAFDASFKTQVAHAVEEMELSREMKDEVLAAVDDAAIFSLTGRRCPMTGTLQRDETDLCPITKLGFEIAKDRSSLLKQLGSEGLATSCQLWSELIEKDPWLQNKFKRDASVKDYLRQVLSIILANDKKNRELPELHIELNSEEFNALVELLRSALNSTGVRPMIAAEACNRMQAWWYSTQGGSVANAEADADDTMQMFDRAQHEPPTNKGYETETNSGPWTSTEAMRPRGDDGDEDASILTESSGELEIPLITRVGGEASIRVLMENFYSDLEKHSSLGHIFRSTKNRDIRAHHTIFLTDLIRGGNNIPDLDLHAAHGPLSVTEEQFNQFLAQFSATTAPLISVDVLSELLAILSRYEPIIVAPKPIMKKKPKKFRMLPSDYTFPTPKEGAVYAMLANMHWNRKARDDMISEITKKMEALRPKTATNKGSFVPSLDSSASLFANLTLEGAHVAMERPENVQLPKDFRAKLGTISIECLAKHRATNERKLMSVYGLVFDVSDRPDKYGVGAPYEELTGKDITWGLACGDDSPPNANKFYDMFKRPELPTAPDHTKGKKAPDYDELYQRISGLYGWINHYKNEYGLPVGKLDVYEREESLPYPPEVQLGCSIT